jgi:hypothetical protein
LARRRRLQAQPLACSPTCFSAVTYEEAIAFYKATVGAEVLMMKRFKDKQDIPAPDKVPAMFDDKIMHACLRINGADSCFAVWLFVRGLADWYRGGTMGVVALHRWRKRDRSGSL